MDMPVTPAETFRALLLSLPTGRSTVRMRLWRALRATGCGVLRDGVYILPSDAPQAHAFAGIESEARSAGGFAMTVDLSLATAEQLAHARALFDRGGDYGALVERISKTRGALRRLGERKAQTAVQRLRRAFDEIAATDFYPGEAQSQAREALSGVELQARELYAEGEPHAAAARVRRLEPAKYRGRTWATRTSPWVDRLASAWLIRRFIDKDAKFAWIERPGDCPKRAVGFDFDGAEFTHIGNRVTYEVLLASFGLADDQALAAIGAAVHFLDVGGIAVPDAKGLETLLTGLKTKAKSDDEMTREAGKIFDLLHRAYSKAGAAAQGADERRT
jgi:hypothetical protein